MTQIRGLENRTILISGATSGIGAAMAERCLEAGAKVVLCGRSLERIEALVRAHEGMALAVHLDVDDATSVDSLRGRLPEGFQDVDTVVCNAGHDVGGRRPFHEGEAAEWTGIIETNVSGVIRLVSTFVGDLLERGDGHIVTVGSTAGLRTYAGGSIYSASKHAVRAFTDGLARDYSTQPIRITEILPGLTRTGFAAARKGGDQAAGDAFYDGFHGCLEPADVAAALIYALTAPAHVNISQLVITPTLEK